jgi:tRNA (guanine37-N1)-methyltransferase
VAGANPYEFDVVTLFPQMFDALTQHGISGRAFESGRCRLRLWNPRLFAADNYRSIDDRPYGGGPGMVMLVQPLEKAIHAVKNRQHESGVNTASVISFSPQGRLLDQAMVKDLAEQQGLILIAGRYEGIDQRFIERAVDREISIGDYVLSGGELPAMVLMDSIIRRLPGVLGDELSAVQDSFEHGLLDHPHYTRPEVYEGMRVPAVLLSGNHREIERWRLKQALGRTFLNRPDMLAARGLSADEQKLLNEFIEESKSDERH